MEKITTKDEINKLMLHLERVRFTSSKDATLRDVCLILTQQNLIHIQILKTLTDIRDYLKIHGVR